MARLYRKPHKHEATSLSVWLIRLSVPGLCSHVKLKCRVFPDGPGRTLASPTSWIYLSSVQSRQSEVDKSLAEHI